MMSGRANPRTRLHYARKVLRRRAANYIAANYASRTMRMTGPIILLYLSSSTWAT